LVGDHADLGEAKHGTRQRTGRVLLVRGTHHFLASPRWPTSATLPRAARE
jgi:hypothetical protein